MFSNYYNLLTQALCSRVKKKNTVNAGTARMLSTVAEVMFQELAVYTSGLTRRPQQFKSLIYRGTKLSMRRDEMQAFSDGLTNK